jgi:UDP-glucose 4-epimerase
MQLLVTGATGKVGANLIERLLSDPRWRLARVRALCHSRTIAETDRIEVFKGSIEDRDCVDRAMRDVTHVVHLATRKEIPETVMDVTVKGLFWRDSIRHQHLLFARALDHGKGRLSLLVIVR